MQAYAKIIMILAIILPGVAQAQDVLFEPGDEIHCAVWNEELEEYTTAHICLPTEKVWLEVDVDALHEEVKIFYTVQKSGRWEPYVADVTEGKYCFPKPHNRFKDVYVLAWPETKVPVNKPGFSILKSRY